MRLAIIILLLPFMVKAQKGLTYINGILYHIKGTNQGDTIRACADTVSFSTKFRSDSLINAVNGKQATLTAGVVQNTHLAGSIAYSKLSLTGAILNGDLAGSIAYSKLSLSGAILNTDLAGSIDLTSKTTGNLPFAQTGGSSAATTATTGTMTVSMTTPIITITPTGACTFNGTGGVVGQEVVFIVTTSGVSSFVLTWGTNYRTTATLSTGTTTAKIFTVTMKCIAATPTWVEIARTTAQ